MASTSTTPISSARFAEALKDLPVSSLHLKAAELRNSIAHLDYSNEQLKPFAEGRDPSQLQETPTVGTSSSDNGGVGRIGVPDQDCIDAIKENEIVIRRMEERISLLKAEVEGRGLSWTEFRSSGTGEDEVVEGKDGDLDMDTDMVGQEGLVNGTSSSSADGQGEGRSSAWTDGTFQTGRIVNGEVRMDGLGGGSEGVSQGVTSTASRSNGTGGRLGDEALRRAMEEQMRNLGNDDDDDEAGMHL